MTRKIRLLPSGTIRDEGRFFLSTFLVDDRIAIDAGGLGIAPLAVQRGVRDVFLTHSHLDQVATLPVYLENVFRPEGPAPAAKEPARATWSPKVRCGNRDGPPRERRAAR